MLLQLPQHLQVPVCGASSSKTRKRYFVAPCQRMKMKMKLKTDEDEVEDRWTNVAPELMDPADLIDPGINDEDEPELMDHAEHLQVPVSGANGSYTANGLTYVVHELMEPTVLMDPGIKMKFKTDGQHSQQSKGQKRQTIAPPGCLQTRLRCRVASSVKKSKSPMKKSQVEQSQKD